MWTTQPIGPPEGALHCLAFIFPPLEGGCFAVRPNFNSSQLRLPIHVSVGARNAAVKGAPGPHVPLLWVGSFPTTLGSDLTPS